MQMMLRWSVPYLYRSFLVDDSLLVLKNVLESDLLSSRVLRRRSPNHSCGASALSRDERRLYLPVRNCLAMSL